MCKEEKSFESFYGYEKTNKKNETYIYYHPYCKDCAKVKVINKRNENRDENLKKMRKYNKEYVQRPYVREKQRITWKRFVSEGKFELWQKNNRDKLYNYHKDRRLNKTHEITNKEWLLCKEYFSNSCAYCGLAEKEHKKIHKQQLHKDHVIHEGRNDIKNCLPACKVCNSKKWTYSLNNWYSPDNEIYTFERYFRIYTWLRYDVKDVIEKKKIK
jgi:hypothetical protein